MQAPYHRRVLNANPDFRFLFKRLDISGILLDDLIAFEGDFCKVVREVGGAGDIYND